MEASVLSISEEVEQSSATQDDFISLAKRRPRRQNCRMPLRYRNEQPMSLPNLPPTLLPPTVPIANTTQNHHIVPHQAQLYDSRQLLTTLCNTFGLFRQYHAVLFPSHDPDAEVQPSDMSDLESDNDSNKSNSSSEFFFQPYPNKNTFLLGEWYWNGGVQKTKEGFKKLIDIICDQSFDPADIRDVHWDSVNNQLGEPLDSEDTWVDVPDAGWTETSITMSIPFHRNTPNPGIHQYKFPPFCHRSIVSVLREKVTNKDDFQHFHLVPYELRWRRKNMLNTQSTRVHGELYTSAAFLEAHEEIQTLIGEPECSLQRVLVGLMFGSDSTQLTSFGNASLWPCYMYFGNESKYRRCKPTFNLCNHIAYFQKVCFSTAITMLHNIIHILMLCFSHRSHLVLKILQHLILERKDPVMHL